MPTHGSMQKAGKVRGQSKDALGLAKEAPFPSAVRGAGHRIPQVANQRRYEKM